MDKRVCEYTVIKADMFGCYANINEKVNALIKDGWQPLGSVVPHRSVHGPSYLFQTMVRYEE